MTNHDRTTHVMRYENAMRAVRLNFRNIAGVSGPTRAAFHHAILRSLESARRIRTEYLQCA